MNTTTLKLLLLTFTITLSSVALSQGRNSDPRESPHGCNKDELPMTDKKGNVYLCIKVQKLKSKYAEAQNIKDEEVTYHDLSKK